MATYRVSFYTNVQSPGGHNFKCLHGHIDVAAIAPSSALQVAEHKLRNTPIEIESFEVAALPYLAHRSLAAGYARTH